MAEDKLRLRIITATTLLALLFSFFIPSEAGSRIVAAILLSVCSGLASFKSRKRSIPSINKWQVLLLSSVSGLLFVMGVMLSGLHFGFSPSLSPLNATSLLGVVLPSVIIILSGEQLRRVALSAEDRFSSVLVLLALVTSEAVMSRSFWDVGGISSFMDLVGMTLMPAVTANFTYHYLTRRYGMLPSLSLRAILFLYPYLLPYEPAIPSSLLALLKLIFPLLVYGFISLLYENRQRRAVRRGSGIPGAVLTAVVLLISLCLSLLVSNRFTFGVLVIGSESMTGELNKGDLAVFEQYGEQAVDEGTVVVLDRHGSTVVHRVIQIERINGENRYVTKGDANEHADYGYVTDAEIIGIVKMKIPYVGYPTIWLTNIFNSGKEVTPDVRS